MLCIDNTFTNAYFNIAAEEYLIKNFPDDIFMLWSNEPSVIIGKYQNTLAEINLDFVKQNDIKVVRRLSGGGTVYHDSGNLNFTFIKNSETADFNDFSTSILEILLKMGIQAETDERNAILINGLKVSGSAQCVQKNRIMYHGTLLFSSDIDHLIMALHTNTEQYESKAVQSVRSKVTNINQYLPELTITDFKELVMKYFIEKNPDSRPYSFNDLDITCIQKLSDEKYVTWDWNFGRSPHYSFSGKVSVNGIDLRSFVNVSNGRIIDLKITDELISSDLIREIEQSVTGCRHDKDNVSRRLNETAERLHIDNSKMGYIIRLIV